MGQKKVRRRVSPEEFVTAWRVSDSVLDVCRATGMNKSAALVRARDYRQRGIALRQFAGRGRPTLNVANLQSIANGTD